MRPGNNQREITHTHTNDTSMTHTQHKHTVKVNTVTAHTPCYVQLLVKWNSKQFTLTIDVANKANTMRTVKHMLAGLTMVECKRQKLIGLKYEGRVPEDHIPLLHIKKLQKYMRIKKKNPTNNTATHTHTHTHPKPVKLLLIGSPASEYVTQTPLNLPFVENDLSLDFSYDTKDCKGILDNPLYKARLEHCISHTKINLLHQPRKGKPLVVIDLDYTLLEMKSMHSVPLMQLKRPFTDLFLSVLYQNYDIAIWSATHWHWLEIKLTELGMLTHPKYKIMFVLDKSSMFRIMSSNLRTRTHTHTHHTHHHKNKNKSKSKKNKHKSAHTHMNVDNALREHRVKPLQIIWRKFPNNRYTAANTIHIDDLSRNFACNPKCGLKIKGVYVCQV